MPKIGEQRIKDSFCSYCGTPFHSNEYPKKCSHCKRETYSNAPSVGIGLIPINDGILTVRRNIPPGIGELALPGGYMNMGETWEEGVAREVFEETGIVVNPKKIKLADVKTADSGAVLIFGLAERLFLPTPLPFNNCKVEVQESLVVTTPVPLCFPHHQTMLEWYFVHHRLFQECGACKIPAHCYHYGCSQSS